MAKKKRAGVKVAAPAPAMTARRSLPVYFSNEQEKKEFIRWVSDQGTALRSIGIKPSASNVLSITAERLMDGRIQITVLGKTARVPR